MAKKKGSNPPGKHNCSIGGGPASKKGNKFGAVRRNRKYLAQWDRTAANKARRIARQDALNKAAASRKGAAVAV